MEKRQQCYSCHIEHERVTTHLTYCPYQNIEEPFQLPLGSPKTGKSGATARGSNSGKQAAPQLLDVQLRWHQLPAECFAPIKARRRFSAQTVVDITCEWEGDSGGWQQLLADKEVRLRLKRRAAASVCAKRTADHSWCCVQSWLGQVWSLGVCGCE